MCEDGSDSAGGVCSADKRCDVLVSELATEINVSIRMGGANGGGHNTVARRRGCL